METEKTPQFTIIVADKPEEEALASIDSSSSSKAAKKQAEAKHAAEVQERIKSIKTGQEKVYPVDVQSLYEVSNPTLRTKLIAAANRCCYQRKIWPFPVCNSGRLWHGPNGACPYFKSQILSANGFL